ncbi:MAG: ECF transporter S component [Bacillota bacterium]
MENVSNNKNEQATSLNTKTNDMVVSALLITLVLVATKFINIRLPISINGGLIHLGNVALFISAIVFGKKKGAIAGAFGMGLFDIISGWALWAPFTFVIRGVMGYIVGAISHASNRKGKSIFWNLVAVLVGGIWMIFGYYLTEGILYGNWIAPVTSIPGNITQLILGVVIGLPISKIIIKFVS